ncbi:hypothetical protein [Burkholderia vietnamiensis]|uniref:hypothetical protein n=1 Tax=Burkholderia vietnamiensis TaxID=60552 RepID=UPI001592D009|nr:hypothetical protein [Burkholderia vietnamiensis]MEC4596278.1 hypothetical protein [Burkholderia vietnamiensis]HDR9008682.1 hypothetical protein [Burkholderia vietnamiensis]HDR9013796.1 hypothetical protein [Burkholderia vietnamiensis]
MASANLRNQDLQGQEDLLKHRLVIVLGEPGSGKSEELKAQRQKRAESFLLGLERLVNEPVAHILSEDEMERFRRWQRGDGDALFLLDAVDESKLRHDDDFAYAIERLSKEIGPALSRCRFVVTSRVSEWRAETDLRIVMERLLANQTIQLRGCPAYSRDEARKFVAGIPTRYALGQCEESWLRLAACSSVLKNAAAIANFYEMDKGTTLHHLEPDGEVEARASALCPELR